MQDVVALIRAAIGLLSLGVVALVTLRSLKHPEKITRLMHDGPLGVMYIAGLALLLPLGRTWMAVYAACVILSNAWFIFRVCSHCRLLGETGGPSLHCALANRLVRKADEPRFAERFRREALVVAVGWVMPPVGGVVLLVQHWGTGWPFAGDLVTVLGFSLIAFWLVPVAAKPACQRCDNREECPRGRACAAKQAR